MNIRRFFSACALMTFGACGDSFENGNTSMDTKFVSKNAPQQATEAFPMCKKNVVWTHENAPHRDCGAVDLRCSCFPGDNDGYFGCACAQKAQRLTPESEGLWIFDTLRVGYQEIVGLKSISSEADSVVFTDTSGHFKINPYGKVSFSGKNASAILGPATLDKICGGPYGQHCEISLKTETYESPRGLRVRPTALTVKLVGIDGSPKETTTLKQVQRVN